MQPADIHKIQNRILLRDGKQKASLPIMDHWPAKRNEEGQRVTEFVILGKKKKQKNI